MNLSRKFVALCGLFLCVSAGGEELELLNDVAPLLTERHFMVVRVDVAAIDLDATVNQQLDDALVKAGGEKLSTDDAYREFQRSKDHFSKIGGKMLYLLADDAAGQLTVVTLDKKTDPAAHGVLAGLFGMKLIQAGPAATDMREMNEMVAKTHTGLLLLGQRTAVDRAIPTDPVDRPDLAKALSAAGDAPVTLAIMPPRAIQKALAQMPQLPDELGGGQTAPLGQIAWVSLGVSPSKKTPLTLTIQCESAQAAKDLKTLLDTVLPAANALFTAESKKNGKNSAELSALGLALLLGNELNLQVKGDTIVGRLDEKGMTAVMERLAVFITDMRATRKLVASQMNIRNICMAMHVYANDNQDTFPPDLGVLVTKGHLQIETLDNPRMPDRKPGYVYVKPTKTREHYNNMHNTIFVYENYDTWPRGGIAVGFLDGHMNFVETEAEFKKLLDATHAANK